MGYGPVVNGKHTPITPYKGSWAATVNTKPMNRPVVPMQAGPALTKEQKLEDAYIMKAAEYYYQI